MDEPAEAIDDRPAALLLDLGGVVVDIAFDRVFERWGELAGLPLDDVRSRFSMDEDYERHERGEIDADTYFAGIRAALGSDVATADLIDGWNAVYVGLFDGVAELLAELAAAIPLYALTNTNPTHAAHWEERFAPVLVDITTTFVSSSIGARKPEPAVFELVADAVGIPVGRFHFFDDSPTNVDGARAAGMPATLVTSFDQFAAAARALV